MTAGAQTAFTCPTGFQRFEKKFYKRLYTAKYIKPVAGREIAGSRANKPISH
jgi:hypothetical protein